MLVLLEYIYWCTGSRLLENWSHHVCHKLLFSVSYHQHFIWTSLVILNPSQYTYIYSDILRHWTKSNIFTKILLLFGSILFISGLLDFVITYIYLRVYIHSQKGKECSWWPSDSPLEYLLWNMQNNYSFIAYDPVYNLNYSSDVKDMNRYLWYFVM